MLLLLDSLYFIFVVIGSVDRVDDRDQNRDGSPYCGASGAPVVGATKWRKPGQTWGDLPRSPQRRNPPSREPGDSNNQGEVSEGVFHTRPTGFRGRKVLTDRGFGRCDGGIGPSIYHIRSQGKTNVDKRGPRPRSREGFLEPGPAVFAPPPAARRGGQLQKVSTPIR